MDRVTPTRRPEGENAGTQRWRDLLFMHWPVPVELVRPLVPKRLSLDLFEGQLYVGLVPFAMHEVAPSWLPGALAFDFLECNLRTYVHLDGEEPGVWFFSLEAASWLAVQAARAGWGLPYHHAAMTSVLDRGHRVYETVRRGELEVWELVNALIHACWFATLRGSTWALRNRTHSNISYLNDICSTRRAASASSAARSTTAPTRRTARRCTRSTISSWPPPACPRLRACRRWFTSRRAWM